MKKVLTILAVMLLMTGFAFAIDTPDTSDEIPHTTATEMHTIEVHTWVDVVLPVFNFQVRDRAGVKTNTSNKFDKVADSVLVVEDTAYIRGDSADAAEDNDIANSAISEYFEIYSASEKANIVSTFDFVVTADPFKHDVTSYETEGTITYAYTPATVASGEHIETSTEDVAVGFKAIYSGKQQNSNVLLGTVKVTWPKDDNAAPGSYTANVYLTVTAE